ncbi:PAP2 superfamily protein [Flexibacter flexilis DSM 6793]|uniref:PAP2 superfamily protein n=1 Tax=Flexibacter flexilis DSM 6793 TaxID=927664 RepID=A0A1I1DYW0_9BACT|nr:phosphatase PAP2 family protein [Flexibacter flexilis]SFB79616.1 PAP2 superfamily protein [Flexibacter flexilis DSM 6793]
MKKTFCFLILLPMLSVAQPADTLKVYEPSTNFSDKLSSLYRHKHFCTYVVPTSLIGAGLAMAGKSPESGKNELKEARDKFFPAFHSHIDDQLQFAPIAVAYGLDALGLHSKTDFLNKSIILMKSELAMTAIVTGLKYTVRETRPDKSAKNSFPSGHTAQAFVAATFLDQEYGQRYPWLSCVGYVLASSVGAMRVLNNKHYMSDVLAGAGIGYLSVKLAYATHQYRFQHKRKKAIKF